MNTSSSAYNDDDDAFEYVAPSKVTTQQTTEKRAGKTIYEIERDARVGALVESQTPTDKKESAFPVHSSPPPHTMHTNEAAEGGAAEKPPLTATEMAQRLKEQRYANYRRNRDLNHSALREVDPETRRFMQIACAPASGGARQYQTVRRGGFGRGSAAAGNRFGSRGDRAPKRRRDG